MFCGVFKRPAPEIDPGHQKVIEPFRRCFERALQPLNSGHEEGRCGRDRRHEVLLKEIRLCFGKYRGTRGRDFPGHLIEKRLVPTFSTGEAAVQCLRNQSEDSL